MNPVGERDAFKGDCKPIRRLQQDVFLPDVPLCDNGGEQRFIIASRRRSPEQSCVNIYLFACECTPSCARVQDL